MKRPKKVLNYKSGKITFLAYVDELERYADRLEKLTNDCAFPHCAERPTDEEIEVEAISKGTHCVDLNISRDDNIRIACEEMGKWVRDFKRKAMKEQKANEYADNYLLHYHIGADKELAEAVKNAVITTYKDQQPDLATAIQVVADAVKEKYKKLSAHICIFGFGEHEIYSSYGALEIPTPKNAKEAAEKLQERRYWGLYNKYWLVAVDGSGKGHSTETKHALKFPSKEIAEDYAKQMNLKGYEAKEL